MNTPYDFFGVKPSSSHKTMYIVFHYIWHQECGWRKLVFGLLASEQIQDNIM